jgi:hypothetical protein
LYTIPPRRLKKPATRIEMDSKVPNRNEFTMRGNRSPGSAALKAGKKKPTLTKCKTVPMMRTIPPKNGKSQIPVFRMSFRSLFKMSPYTMIDSANSSIPIAKRISAKKFGLIYHPFFGFTTL